MYITVRRGEVEMTVMKVSCAWVEDLIIRYKIYLRRKRVYIRGVRCSQ